MTKCKKIPTTKGTKYTKAIMLFRVFRVFRGLFFNSIKKNSIVRWFFEVNVLIQVVILAVQVTN
jgi:hypothetical protein